MSIEMTAVFARNESCPVREIGSGLVIMAPAGDVTHSLEDLGAFIWNLLDGTRELDAVLDAVVQEYDVERAVAADDLQVFIGDLLDANIIHSVS